MLCKVDLHNMADSYNVTQPFSLVVEATVGVPGDSDIAVDDFSFTPNCT